MGVLKLAFSLCSAASYLFLIGFVLQFLFSFISSIIKRKTFVWRQWNPYHGVEKENRIRAVIFSVLFLIGIALPFLSVKFGTTKMGDFWEKADYKEAYEATLYVDDVPMYCVATVWRNTELWENSRGRTDIDSRYHIVELFLPFGKSAYTDDEYYPDQETSSIRVNDWSCEIKLGGIATEDSYELLKSEVPINYGEFCGSKNSDTFHLLDCRYVKKINPENLVYFSSREMAEVLGYSMCEVCRDRY